MIFLSNNVNFASYLRTHKYTQCALLLLELTLISPYAMTSENTVFFSQEPIWNRNIPITATVEEAMRRLDAILTDKLLWFNPYRVADRALLDCAERGR